MNFFKALANIYCWLAASLVFFNLSKYPLQIFFIKGTLRLKILLFWQKPNIKDWLELPGLKPLPSNPQPWPLAHVGPRYCWSFLVFGMYSKNPFLIYLLVFDAFNSIG